MLENPQIHLSPGGSLHLSQGATLERVVCLGLGTAVLLGFIALAIEDLPLNAGDALVFCLAMGFLLGALSLSSLEARLDSHSQQVLYRREQWGFAWQREWKFAEIKSLRRVARFDSEGENFLAIFFLRVGSKEWPLVCAPLALGWADELEAHLRTLLPQCPFESSSPPQPGIDEALPLSQISSPFEDSLQLASDKTLIIAI